MKIDLTDKQATFLMRCLLENYTSILEDYDSSSDITAANTGDFIIGKLIGADSKLRDIFNTTKKNRWKKCSEKIEYLFMGTGYHSTIKLNNLHKKIQYAAGILSGMQQNGGMGTEFNETAQQQDKQSLKEIVLDILTAFGLTVDDLK